MVGMFDNHAFEALRDYFSPDELDRVVLDDLQPYLPLEKLLRIFKEGIDHNLLLPNHAPLPPESERVTLAEAMTAGRLLAEHLDKTVSGWMTGHLRAEGKSWTEVGKVLGVSKQAAHERFTRYVSTLAAWPDLQAEHAAVLPDDSA